MTCSLVFVLKLISTFIGQNKEFFFIRAEENGRKHVIKDENIVGYKNSLHEEDM